MSQYQRMQQHPIVGAMHEKAKQEAKTIRLGELIAELEKVPPDTAIAFDFCCLTPTRLASYRGTYSMLALGHGDRGSITASALLTNCRDAIGKEFIGYKGGEFLMDADTPVWVDNDGEATATAIVGLTPVRYGWSYIVTSNREE